MHLLVLELTSPLELDQLLWVMCSVLVMNQVSFPVSRLLYIHTTVNTRKMLEFPANVSDSYGSVGVCKLQVLCIPNQRNRVLLMFENDRDARVQSFGTKMERFLTSHFWWWLLELHAVSHACFKHMYVDADDVVMPSFHSRDGSQNAWLKSCPILVSLILLHVMYVTKMN